VRKNFQNGVKNYRRIYLIKNPAASRRGIMNVLAPASIFLRRKQRGIYPQVIKVVELIWRNEVYFFDLILISQFSIQNQKKNWKSA
jgi:hypothetical protein